MTSGPITSWQIEGEKVEVVIDFLFLGSKIIADRDLNHEIRRRLLLSTLSIFLLAFLPISNHLLISWLQSPSAMILEPKKRKSVTSSTFSPSICHEITGLDAMILVF